MPRQRQATAALSYSRYQGDFVTSAGVRVLDFLNRIGKGCQVCAHELGQVRITDVALGVDGD